MTAFDAAFSLLKIGKPQSEDEFLRYEDLMDGDNTQRFKGLSSLGRIFGNGGAEYGYQDAIMEQLLDPSNQYSMTDAQTPTLYRAESVNDDDKYPIAANDFRHGRYFSPQRLTAEQYAAYQEQNRGVPSDIHEYEMPVPLRDDSVLNVPIQDFGRGIEGKKQADDSPDVNRVAAMNDMTIPEAQKALQAWHSVYMGATPQSRENMTERFAPLMDAGYDYVTWPEFASAAYYPPTAASAFGSVDWGAGHEAKYNRKEVEEWWKPARQAMMEQMGIPQELKNDGAMGKHSSFPQWAAYHIGEEDSAPEYKQYHGFPKRLPYKYQTVDYPNFSAAAGIAEKDLGITDKRWESR